MRRGLWSAAFLAFATALGVPALGGPAAAAPIHERDSALGAIINRAIHEGGPFFTPAERALIDRKCGYAPGEWDGYDVSIGDGVFRCTNGKTVDDAEMRALIKVAQPRIAARVTAAMAQSEVRAAIHREAMAAARNALANLRIDRRD